MTDLSGAELCVIAGALWADGDHEAAVAALEEAARAYISEGTPARAADCYVEVANIALAYDQPETAASRADLAREIRENEQDEHGLAECQLIMGKVAVLCRRVLDALRWLDGATRRPLAAKDEPLAARCLHAKADLYIEIAQPTKALAPLTVAIGMFGAAGDEGAAAGCELSLASAYGLMGHPDETLRLLESARDKLASSGHPYDRAGCEMSIAVARMEAGYPEEALPGLRSSRQVFANAFKMQEVALCDLNLGAALHALGRHDEAAKHLEGARSIYARSGSPVDAARCDSSLAAVLRDAGRPAEALDAAIRAVAVMDAYRYSLPYSGMRASWSRYAGLAYRRAFELAQEAGDAGLLAELVETARLQAVPTAGPEPPRGAAVVAALPFWAIGPVRGEGAGPPREVRPHFRELSLRPPPLVTVGGRSLVGERDIGVARPHGPVAVEDAARRVGGGEAWWWGSWYVGDQVFWSLVRPGAEPETGVIDVSSGSPAGAVLAAYEASLPQASETNCEWLARMARSALVADAAAEAELAWKLGQSLLPATLRDELARRVVAGEPPLDLVIAPAHVLGRVALGLLGCTPPAPGAYARRVLEAAVVRLSPSVALVEACASRQLPSAPPYPLTLAVVGAGDFDLLADRLALNPERVLGPPSWGGVGPASRANLAEVLGRIGPGAPSVLLYFGHVVPPANPDLPATTALDLAPDDELIAQELLVPAGEPQPFPMPARVLVIGCASAGAEISSAGEWLGFGPAMLWAGARCVVTTSWPILTADTCLDTARDLVDVMCTHADPAAALRDLQLRRLHEWRTAPALDGDSLVPSSHPAPYLWAPFVVLGVE